MRLQPLLLLGAALSVAPAMASIHAQAYVLVFVAAAGLLSLVAWGRLMDGRASRELRERWFVILAGTGVVGLALVFVVDGWGRPDAYLMLSSALLCGLAAGPVRWLRWWLQASVVILHGVALAVEGRALVHLLLPLGLLVIVAVVTDLLADELVRGRGAERRARADAELRGALLERVLDLTDRTPLDAAEATVESLWSLAFDASVISMVRDDDRLHVIRHAGGPPPEEPLRRGEGLGWRAIEGDATVTTNDYQSRPERLAAQPLVRSAVATPVRIGGRPAGVVIGVRYVAEPPTESEVEVVEVLAAHLGGMLDTQQQVDRQRQLLRRVGELDRMRSGFVSAVSAELRERLTVVRSVGYSLANQGGTIDPALRETLLERLSAHTLELRRTIDALLDFSRFQSERADPVLERITVGDLLRPALRSVAVRHEVRGLEQAAEVEVKVDAERLRHAVELLLAGREVALGVLDATIDLDVIDGHVQIQLPHRSAPSTLVESLVVQLVLAAGAEFRTEPCPTLLLPRSQADVPVATG